MNINDEHIRYIDELSSSESESEYEFAKPDTQPSLAAIEAKQSDNEIVVDNDSVISENYKTNDSTVDSGASEIIYENADNDNKEDKTEFFRDELETVGRNQLGKQPRNDKSKIRLKLLGKNLINLLIPVSLTMLMVISVQLFVKTRLSKEDYKGFLLTPYDSPVNIGEVLINGLCFIVALSVMTFLFLLCVYFNISWAIYGLLGFALFSVMFFVTFTLCLKIVSGFNFTLDYVTVLFALYNYGAVGMITLFWKSPLIMKQCYTCIDCAMIATMYIDFMHEYTVWGLLALLILWDVFAVLTPCGPLNILVNVLSKKVQLNKIPPGLVYETMIYLMANKDDINNEINREDDENDNADKEDDNYGVKLGLGDFIFYSLLIGKAADPNLIIGEIDWNTVFACYIVILIGLALTVIVLLTFERALPALPISLTLGLSFYFLTSILITPFFNGLSLSTAFV